MPPNALQRVQRAAVRVAACMGGREDVALSSGCSGTSCACLQRAWLDVNAPLRRLWLRTAQPGRHPWSRVVRIIKAPPAPLYSMRVLTMVKGQAATAASVRDSPPARTEIIDSQPQWGGGKHAAVAMRP